MPTAQLIVEFDNGETYRSEKHEIEGLGVTLADSTGDTLPDQLALYDHVRVLEDVSRFHPDEMRDPSEIPFGSAVSNRPDHDK